MHHKFKKPLLLTIVLCTCFAGFIKAQFGFNSIQREITFEQEKVNEVSLSPEVAEALRKYKAALVKQMIDIEDDSGPKSEFKRKQLQHVFGGISTGVTQVLLVSTWRSGSSFMGDLLNALPGSILTFEPLVIEEKLLQLSDSMTTNLKTRTFPTTDYLTSIFNCSYNIHTDLVEEWLHNGNPTFLERQKKLKKACESKNIDTCYSADFLRASCETTPIRIAKTVRLRAEYTEPMLENLKNLKVIYLLRDPRGTMTSRRNHEYWCNRVSHCHDINVVCDDFNEDVQVIRRLRKKFPETTMLLRYEDFCLDAWNMTKKIMEFLEVPFLETMQKFVRSHTEENEQDDFATRRISKDVPFRWKEDITLEDLENVQKKCKPGMADLGYLFVENELPVSRDAVFLNHSITVV